MDIRFILLNALVLCITISSSRSAAAVTLSSEKTYRSSSCAATRFQPSCGESHEIIAVESIKHGTKLTCGFQNTSDGCCSYDINDCLLPYTGTTLLAECSGKYVCSGSSPSAIDTSTCVPAQYPVLSHYLTMEYYCLPDSRISKMCTKESNTAAGKLLYLKNQDYPQQIRGDETSCTCSVETKSCESQINVYFLHLDLSNGSPVFCNINQKIVITDQETTHTYTCSDDNYYVITRKLTSTSNYITVQLDNPDGVNDGHFWLGFEATNPAHKLSLDCPKKDQAWCMASTTTTGTTLLTTSTTPTTTSTTTKTTTPSTTTKPTTTPSTTTIPTTTIPTSTPSTTTTLKTTTSTTTKTTIPTRTTPTSTTPKTTTSTTKTTRTTTKTPTLTPIASTTTTPTTPMTTPTTTPTTTTSTTPTTTTSTTTTPTTIILTTTTPETTISTTKTPSPTTTTPTLTPTASTTATSKTPMTTSTTTLTTTTSTTPTTTTSTTIFSTTPTTPTTTPTTTTSTTPITPSINSTSPTTTSTTTTSRTPSTVTISTKPTTLTKPASSSTTPLTLTTPKTSSTTTTSTTTTLTTPSTSTSTTSTTSTLPTALKSFAPEHSKSTEITTTIEPDNGDSDDRLIFILVILAVVIVILIGIVVSVIAVRSRTILRPCQKPNMTGQHSQKAFHSSKVTPMKTQNIKGLHPELRPDAHEYYIDYPDTKSKHFNNANAHVYIRHEDVPMENLNINGLHTELRAKDQIFYVEHPNVKKQGSELYQGTPEANDRLKPPANNIKYNETSLNNLNDTALSRAITLQTRVNSHLQSDNDNIRNERIETYALKL